MEIPDTNNRDTKQDRKLNEMLLQSKDIKVSPYFLSKLHEKIKAVEQVKARIFSPAWLAAPVALSFFIIFMSTFFTVSPLIYGKNDDSTKAAVIKAAVTAVAGSAFAPLDFVKFCNQCSTAMCNCALMKCGNKCVPGGCKHE